MSLARLCSVGGLDRLIPTWLRTWHPGPGGVSLWTPTGALVLAFCGRRFCEHWDWPNGSGARIPGCRAGRSRCCTRPESAGAVNQVVRLRSPDRALSPTLDASQDVRQDAGRTRMCLVPCFSWQTVLTVVYSSGLALAARVQTRLSIARLGASAVFLVSVLQGLVARLVYFLPSFRPVP